MLTNRPNDYIDTFVLFFIESNNDHHRNSRTCFLVRFRFKLSGMKFFAFEVFFLISSKFAKHKCLQYNVTCRTNIYLFSVLNNLILSHQRRSDNVLICCRYGEFRLIDIPHLREVMPLTMENFYKNIKQSSKAASEKLRYQWLPEVCEIVDNHRETVEEWMPQDSVSYRSRSWNSVQPNSECFHFLNARSDWQNF